MKKQTTIIIIVLILLLAIGGGVGAFFLLKDDEKTEKSEGEDEDKDKDSDKDKDDDEKEEEKKNEDEGEEEATPKPTTKTESSTPKPTSKSGSTKVDSSNYMLGKWSAEETYLDTVGVDTYDLTVTNDKFIMTVGAFEAETGMAIEMEFELNYELTNKSGDVYTITASGGKLVSFDLELGDAMLAALESQGLTEEEFKQQMLDSLEESFLEEVTGSTEITFNSDYSEMTLLDDGAAASEAFTFIRK